MKSVVTMVSLGFLFFLPSLQRGTTGAVYECNSLSDCAPVNGSVCVRGNCTCPEDTPVLVVNPDKNVNMSYCLPGSNTTSANCTFNQQCQYENSECREGVCTCLELRYREQDGLCVPQEKNAIVPIAVGVSIGVAVVGTLGLYLWLSRKKEEPSRYN